MAIRAKFEMVSIDDRTGEETRLANFVFKPGRGVILHLDDQSTERNANIVMIFPYQDASYYVASINRDGPLGDLSIKHMPDAAHLYDHLASLGAQTKHFRALNEEAGFSFNIIADTQASEARKLLARLAQPDFEDTRPLSSEPAGLAALLRAKGSKPDPV